MTSLQKQTPNANLQNLGRSTLTAAWQEWAPFLCDPQALSAVADIAALGTARVTQAVRKGRSRNPSDPAMATWVRLHLSAMYENLAPVRQASKLASLAFARPSYDFLPSPVVNQVQA